ncbi:nitroreductase family protein [Clostridium beijerinckii]|uniref:Nitroreductase family protein n=1 Tax=Clostridium beijerinckii TaxID=1520 RepID=A0A1S8RV59_CLOBE|nr:nitroreductase family protein [Clostridium beijerinckii]NRY61719.1 nitroreductase [Clostridium beijerinckii]OOM56945.1 nitroreductase family protein [Clostridium beijerinckii]
MDFGTNDAPSGGNSQTWQFSAVQNKEILLELNGYIKEAFEKLEVDENTYKSKKAGKVASKKDDYNFYYNAPTLIIVSNESSYSNAMVDSACAIENMLFL